VDSGGRHGPIGNGTTQAFTRAGASRRICRLLEQTTNDFSIRMMPTWSGDRLRGFAKQTCVFAILRID
jgi:hypothetical protein